MAYSKTEAKADRCTAQKEARRAEMVDKGVLPSVEAVKEAVIREICQEFGSDEITGFDSFDDMAEFAAEQAAERVEEQAGTHQDLKDDDVVAQAEAAKEVTLEDAVEEFMKSPNLKQSEDGVIREPPK